MAYVVTTPLPSLAAALPLGLLSLPWVILVPRAAAGAGTPFGAVSLILLGVAVVMALGPLVAMPLAEVERLRLRLVDTRPVTSGHGKPHGTGVWWWLRTRYTERATWYEVGHTWLLATVIPVLYFAVLSPLIVMGASIASPFLVDDSAPISLGPAHVSTVEEAVPYALAGVALLPAVPYVLALLAGGHGMLARALLQGGSGERLRAELVEVSRSRVRLVGAFEAERRRIERDLHDGAQQRLISLTLQLGLARLDLPPGSPAAKGVADAHDQAKLLMAELRELIHGIHPQILTDLGLPAALRELADQQAIPVTVDAGDARRGPVPRRGHHVLRRRRGPDQHRQAQRCHGGTHLRPPEHHWPSGERHLPSTGRHRRHPGERLPGESLPGPHQRHGGERHPSPSGQAHHGDPRQWSGRRRPATGHRPHRPRRPGGGGGRHTGAVQPGRWPDPATCGDSLHPQRPPSE